MTKLDTVIGNLKNAKRFKMGGDITIERLKTPSAPLNRALGGGFGYGRQVLVWGTKSAGKTSFLLQCMAEAQRQGKTVAFVDIEGTFDPAWAKRLGVDPDEMLYDDPKSLNEVDKAVVDLLTAGVDYLLLDSITGGVPSAKLSDKGEYQGADSDRSLGSKARQTTEIIEGWNLVNKNTLLAIISQTRKVKKGMYWVDDHTNGQAVGFYSSQVLQLMSSNSRDIEREVMTGGKLLKQAVGREVDWTVRNNKLGPQWGTGTYDFYFVGSHIGVDSVGELVDMATEFGVLSKGGAWYKYGEGDAELKWQGRTNVVDDLRQRPDLLQEIQEAVDGLLTAN